VWVLVVQVVSLQHVSPNLWGLYVSALFPPPLPFTAAWSCFACRHTASPAKGAFRPDPRLSPAVPYVPSGCAAYLARFQWHTHFVERRVRGRVWTSREAKTGHRAALIATGKPVSASTPRRVVALCSP
jgi:hypothetical protein